MHRAIPILADQFYHDGRGPELKRVIWKFCGQILAGFEYFNPDDSHDADHLRHLVLDHPEAYSMASEEVHGDIRANGDTKAAIFQIENSPWQRSFQQRHLSKCHHFQIMFYDEIFDVICRSISSGSGAFPTQAEQGAAGQPLGPLTFLP